MNEINEMRSMKYEMIMFTVFDLIRALRAYSIQEGDRALSQLPNGGFGLKIGQFLAELWSFLYNLLGFSTKMTVSRLIMVQFSI